VVARCPASADDDGVEAAVVVPRPGVAAAVFDRNGNGARPSGSTGGSSAAGCSAATDGRGAAAHRRRAARRDEIDRAAVGLQDLLGDVRFSVRFRAAAGRMLE
jgi:hypothetical protein